MNVNRLYAGRWTVQEPAPKILKKKKKSPTKSPIKKKTKLGMPLGFAFVVGAPSVQSLECASVLESQSNVCAFDFRVDAKPELKTLD